MKLRGGCCSFRSVYLSFPFVEFIKLITMLMEKWSVKDSRVFSSFIMQQQFFMERQIVSFFFFSPLLLFFFSATVLSVPLGFLLREIRVAFTRGKPTATGSCYPPYGACWAFLTQLTYPLTVTVVGAQQMISQPVSFIFPACFPPLFYFFHWVFECFHNPPNSDKDCRIFTVRTDVNVRDCTRECTDTRKRVCTES